jgi:hypothetical protein
MSGPTRLLKMWLVPTILLGTGAVWAQKPPAKPAPEPARQEQEQDRSRGRGSLPDSVRRVERQTGGEVLRAEPMQRDGREVYRLKVLTADGRVRVLQEDPKDPPAGERPPKRRDRDKQEQEQNDSSEGSDADPPL